MRRRGTTTNANAASKSGDAGQRQPETRVRGAGWCATSVTASEAAAFVRRQAPSGRTTTS